jgi:hypothetical protein
MRRGRLSDFADVERAVLSGTHLLWLVAPSHPSPASGGGEGGGIYAAAVTALATVNHERLCTIVACGGRARARWLPLIATLEAFARAEGCRAIRILGRRGWARLLPDYATTRVLLEKHLQKEIA